MCVAARRWKGSRADTKGSPGKTGTTENGGTVYVAVTGSSELAGGTGNMGYAIVAFINDILD